MNYSLPSSGIVLVESILPVVTSTVFMELSSEATTSNVPVEFQRTELT